MYYSFKAPAGIIWIAPPSGWGMPARSSQNQAESDRRWPAMLRRLKGLHKRGRRSIRIVDADCGAGELLSHAVRRAREMGFPAIEGRGVDADPNLVARARSAAARKTDPAIGLVLEQAGKERVMREEAEYPADLLLCSATDAEAREFAALTRTAANTVLWGRTAKTEARPHDPA